MATGHVEVLPASSYRGYLEGRSDGIEAGHWAKVAFEHVEDRAYVKLYRNFKTLNNEITAHLLASALGFAVPERAAVLWVPRDALGAAWPAWCADQTQWPAWCTSRIQTGSLKLAYVADTPAVLKELRASHETPKIAAFDDWLANVDRNLGNLLRISKGRYALIDHGHLMSGPTWSRENLVDQAKYPNKICSIIGSSSETLPFKNAMRGHCDQHLAAWYDCWQVVNKWWRQLLSEDDRKAARAFVIRRAFSESANQRIGLIA